MRLRICRGFWTALLPTVLLVATAAAEENAFSWQPLPTDGEQAFDPEGKISLVSATSYCDGASCAEDSCGYEVGSCGYEDESSCDLLPCEECCCPLWTIEAGAIFLRRDNQDSVPLTNGAAPIDAHDLSFNSYQPGLLVSIMRHQFLNTDTTFEVTYFGVNDNTSAVSSSTAFFTTPTINYALLDVNVNYHSRFDSTEFNLRRQWNDWFTVLAGFRWLELSDTLATDFGGIASHNVNVNNHLFGAQIGGDALIWSGQRFSVQWFGKAGIYSNFADQTTNIVGVGGAVPALSASGNETAFLGEMSLTGTYYLSDCWSIRGGYQALWLDGIALAPDQLAVSNAATGAATLDSNSNPIYHGFMLTTQLTWQTFNQLKLVSDKASAEADEMLGRGSASRFSW